MNVLDPTLPLKAHLSRTRGWVVVFWFGVIVVAWSLTLLATRWPDQLMILLTIPIVWSALHYPRTVYISMIFIAMVASVGVTYELSNTFSASLETIALGAIAILAMAEVTHRLVTARRQTEETLQQRNQELAGLNAIIATITATLETDQVFQRLVDTIDELFPQAIAATLQLLDESDNVLRTVAASATYNIPISEKIGFQPGQGAAGLALKTRRLINIADIETDPRFLKSVTAPVYRSLLVAPLIIGERVWGTLSVEGKDPGAFQTRDERLIQSLALQATIAVENAHLYQETARRATEQATVARVTRALNASLDVEQAFPTVAEGLCTLTDCDRVSLAMSDEINQQFTLVVLDSPFIELRQGVTLPWSASAAVSSLQHGRAHITPDLATESQYPAEGALFEAGFRSRVNLPLITGDQVIGALNLASRRLSAFAEADLPPLQQIADALATTIVKSRLHTETAHRLAKVRALAKASTHLTARLELDATLSTLVEQAQIVLGADRVSIYLLDQQTNRLGQIHAVGLSDDYLDGIRQFYRDTPAFQILNGEPIWVEDAQAEGVADPMQDMVRREGFQTMLILPLSHHAQLLGGLALYYDQRRTYDQALLDLAQAFANQSAVALENAQLFDRVRSAEAQYRALFQDSADPLAVLDTEGIVLDANPATCRMMGKSRDELLGHSLQAFYQISDDRFRQAIQQVLNGEVYVLEFSMPVDGKTRHYESRVERVDYSDQVALQWVAYDVTDRRELDHWREELTDISVHNLRNPLTWVKSGTELAHMLLPDDIDPVAVRALEQAIRGVDRLEQQIDVLLNISRAESGQELTGQELVSPASLVTDVIELLHPRAAVHGIQLEAKLPQELPMIPGNRNMLVWTLENLAENAIKFSPRGETVTIRAAVGTPNGAPKDGTNRLALCFSVTDRGPGVPPEERKHIFLKFYQVDHPQKSKGSGFGLYFCRLAVKAHGGQIWVESNHEGQGSTFKFTLPL